MARIRYNGLDEYIAKIRELNGSTVHIANEALYNAAGLLADAVDEEIDKIPNNLINEVQRQGLHEGLGIATFKYDLRSGSMTVDTRTGFDGYNDLETRQSRKMDAHLRRKIINPRGVSGQPNAEIARIVAKGTSHRPAHYDFVKIAVRKSKKRCIDEMRKTFNEEIEKNMRG